MSDHHHFQPDDILQEPTWDRGSSRLHCILHVGGAQPGRAYYNIAGGANDERRSVAHFLQRINAIVDEEGRPWVAHELVHGNDGQGLCLG